MDAYSTIIKKFKLSDYQLTEVPIFSTNVSKRKLKSIRELPPERIDSFIRFHMKTSKLFNISLILLSIVCILFLTFFILKELVKISMPINFIIPFIILGLFFLLFGVAYLLHNKGLYKVQLGRIFKSTSSLPDYIWQHTEAEFQQQTISYLLKEKLFIIDPGYDTYASTFKFDDIVSWHLSANIVYDNKKYSGTSAGAKISHDIYMLIFMLSETDPYSSNAGRIVYLNAIELELKFKTGNTYRFKVNSSHVNFSYGLMGYEDFKISRSRFMKMINLIKCGIMLYNECPKKGSFVEAPELKK